MNMDRPPGWVPILLAGMLGACGDSPPAGQPETQATAARNPATEFTAAVPVGNDGAAARLAFQLVDRPVVSQPLTLRFRVMPTGKVRRIQLVFEPDAGLGFVDELRATLQLEGDAALAAQPHELQVIPTVEGVLLLRATLLTETDAGSQTSDFAIPLLVTAATPPVTGG
jgi:hypothetical protein